MAAYLCDKCMFDYNVNLYCEYGHDLCRNCVENYMEENLVVFVKHFMEEIPDLIPERYTNAKSIKLEAYLGNKELIGKLLISYLESSSNEISSEICPVCRSTDIGGIIDDTIYNYIKFMFDIDIVNLKHELIKEHGDVLGVTEHVNSLARNEWGV